MDASQQLTYRCRCDHVLNVRGGGRHRIFFEPADFGLGDPILNGVCPACARPLPGKGHRGGGAARKHR